MKPILEIRNIAKRYIIARRKERYLSLRDSLIRRFKSGFNKSKQQTFWALDDITFDVYPGDTIGIIGKNGAGKSTLLKILSKITPPTRGYVKARGKIASLLEVGTGFHPELTGSENIYLNGSILGLKRNEIVQCFDEIVDFSGVENFLETPLKHYSSGMQLRLAFSVAAHLQPDILIVDEVLAVGDAEFQKKCLGKMQKVSRDEGRTVLFVSHDLEAVQQLCSETILLENGKLKFIGQTVKAIKRYTINVTQFKKKIYSKGNIVESVEILQEDRLKIVVHYNFEEVPLIPHFGFVVSNEKGQPLFGSNPTIAKVEQSHKYSKSGVVEVVIESPVLTNGLYNLSVWMGNGIENYFEDLNCLKFEVSPIKVINPKLGFITPHCKFMFY